MHEIEGHYPFSADTVIRAFCDTAFHKQKLALPNQVGSSEIVQSSALGAVYSIQIARTVSLKVPGLKLAAITLLTEEHWNCADKTGAISVDIKGMPVKMSCVARVLEFMRGSVVHCTWTIEASVPLIGRKIEKAISEEISARSEREAELTRELFEPYSMK